MTIISLIAAIDKEGAIGYKNQLLCHLPADLQHFKKLTIGKPVIMGRLTFESIGKPLPNRTNIVLSGSSAIIDGVRICNSLEEAVKQVKESPEVMIIGGGQIYAKAIPLANQMYITKINHTFNADSYFPVIDNTQWKMAEEIHYPADEKNCYDMTFVRYVRKNPL